MNSLKYLLALAMFSSTDAGRNVCSFDGELVLKEQLSKSKCEEGTSYWLSESRNGVIVDKGCEGEFILPSGVEVHCKSESYSRNTCEAAGGADGGRVHLVEKISNANCEESVSFWSLNGGKGVKVDKGCEADFLLSTGETIRCKSEGFGEKVCGDDGRRRLQVCDVSLKEQLSKSSCELGKSYGLVNGQTNRMWVDNGCRGVFVLPNSEEISCASQKNKRNDDCQKGSDTPCSDGGSVVLVSGNSSCVKGRTFGMEGTDSVWVDGGCSGVFKHEDGRQVGCTSSGVTPPPGAGTATTEYRMIQTGSEIEEIDGGIRWSPVKKPTTIWQYHEPVSFTKKGDKAVFTATWKSDGRDGSNKDEPGSNPTDQGKGISDRYLRLLAGTGDFRIGFFDSQGVKVKSGVKEGPDGTKDFNNYEGFQVRIHPHLHKDFKSKYDARLKEKENGNESHINTNLWTRIKPGTLGLISDEAQKKDHSGFSKSSPWGTQPKQWGPHTPFGKEVEIKIEAEMTSDEDFKVRLTMNGESVDFTGRFPSKMKPKNLDTFAITYTNSSRRYAYVEITNATLRSLSSTKSSDFEEEIVRGVERSEAEKREDSVRVYKSVMIASICVAGVSLIVGVVVCVVLSMKMKKMRNEIERREENGKEVMKVIEEASVKQQQIKRDDDESTIVDIEYEDHDLETQKIENIEKGEWPEDA